jgi:hypothetical protein
MATISGASRHPGQPPFRALRTSVGSTCDQLDATLPQLPFLRERVAYSFSFFVACATLMGPPLKIDCLSGRLSLKADLPFESVERIAYCVKRFYVLNSTRYESGIFTFVTVPRLGR